MNKKVCLLVLSFVVLLLSVSLTAAAPVPPAKGQWALALEDSLPLHTKPSDTSRYTDIDMPNKWISVPSATRDGNNYLWYKVTIDGKTGWLPQNGVRLKMGGKSKAASNLYKNYVKARRNVINNPVEWDIYDEGEGIRAYAIDGSELKVAIDGKRVEDVYFQTDDATICKKFLGVNLIGLYQPEVRKRLGTPTMRETPADDIDINVLSFELDGYDLTLSITEIRESGHDEGKVISVSIYRGRTGEPY